MRCVALLLVSVVAAMGGPILSTYNYVRWYNEPGNPTTLVCSNSNGAACVGSVVAPGTNWTVNYDSSSSSSYGVLHAAASVYLTGDNSLGPLNGGSVPFPNLASVGARGSFLDGFTIGGGSGTGTVDLTFQVTGTSSNTAGQSGRPQFAYVPVVAGALDYAGQVQYSVVSGSTTIPITFTFGSPFEFDIDFYALAQIYQWVPGASASADYSNTAILDAITVYNSQGNVVPSFTIQSESGTSYGSGGVVPEPLTVVLVASSLLLLCFIRTKKSFLGRLPFPPSLMSQKSVT